MVNQKLTNFSLKRLKRQILKITHILKKIQIEGMVRLTLLKKVKVRQDILMVNY